MVGKPKKSNLNKEMEEQEMTRKSLITLIFAFVLGLGWSLARAAEFPLKAKFKTIATFGNTIEGLTVDNNGDLFTAGVGNPCPVLRVNPDPPIAVQQVGQISASCFPLGMAFNSAGELFIANAAQGKIVSLVPDAGSPPTATDFASGVPGVNGLAFDKDGNLFASDGVTNQGRVWKIAPGGGVCEPSFIGCEEVFRTQPMRNDVITVDTPDGVGRQILDRPPDVEQGIVANGLAFTPYGDLLVADTARGAIWKVEFGPGGEVSSETGCDETFAANTLCLDNILVAHPCLEGADGIALDTEGNIVVDSNERNALCIVKTDGTVIEIARNNPNPTTGLRNGGPLEFNSSPVIRVKTLCTANFDRGRRDNFPASGGSLDPAGANRGNIVCMKEELPFEGLALPVL